MHNFLWINANLRIIQWNQKSRILGIIVSFCWVSLGSIPEPAPENPDFFSGLEIWNIIYKSQ